MALDTSSLNVLIKDDWDKLFKPLNSTHINCENCCQTSSASTARFDDLFTRQTDLEERFETFEEVSGIKDVTELLQQIKDVSADVSKIAEEQNEISTFLNSLLGEWENQDGTPLN